MYSLSLLLFLFLDIYCSDGFLIPDGIQKVSTKVGDIIGFTDQVRFGNQTLQVRKYLGIPYAEPPIGNLRFEKPVMKTSLQSPYKAVSYSPKCVQAFLPENDSMSEDCLYLNIFTPEVTITSSSSSPKPVMIWIHGGGFLVGYANPYEGDVISALNDVIVVSINYRIGVLGFFSSHDSRAKGNYGLWDQHLAIRWVRENIADFGGDPQSITIFGESAGSSSVIYQMLYPGNKGLFKRAIAESGTVAAWAISHGNTNLDSSVQFANSLGCSDLLQMVSCLRQKSEAEIISATKKIENAPINEVNRTWVPIFDNDFVLAKTPDIISELLDPAIKMKKYRNFMDIDLLIGANNFDGNVYQDLTMRLLNNISPSSINYKVSQNQLKDFVVPRALESWLDEMPTQLAIDLTVSEYTEWEDPLNGTKRFKNVLDIWTDYALNSPTISTANAHSNTNSSTYLYQFSTTPPKRYLPIAPALEGQDVACHSDELPYVFGFSENLKKLWQMSDNLIGTNDYSLSKDIMTMWTNFAKSG